MSLSELRRTASPWIRRRQKLLRRRVRRLSNGLIRASDKLGRKGWFALICGLASVVGLVFGIWVWKYPKEQIQLVQRTERPATVSVVDATIEEKTEGFPLLDLKVRNTGDQVAFLKTATFSVTDIFTIEDPI